MERKEKIAKALEETTKEYGEMLENLEKTSKFNLLEEIQEYFDKTLTDNGVDNVDSAKSVITSSMMFTIRFLEKYYDIKAKEGKRHD